MTVSDELIFCTCRFRNLFCILTFETLRFKMATLPAQVERLHSKFLQLVQDRYNTNLYRQYRHFRESNPCDSVI